MTPVFLTLVILAGAGQFKQKQNTGNFIFNVGIGGCSITTCESDLEKWDTLYCVDFDTILEQLSICLSMNFFTFNSV